MRNFSKFRLFLVVAVATALLSGCFWDRHFDLAWEEEVQLLDGRVVVVQRKVTYERLRVGLTPYGGVIIPRDSTIAFDAGGKIGRVTQLFKGFHPMFLDQDAGAWYAVLYGSYYYGSRQLPGQDWGDLEGPYGQWTVKLVDGKWTPVSMRSLPSQFQRPNILLLYGNAAEHSRFDGRRVTLAEKRSWAITHPPGYADVRLTRPTSAGPTRKQTE